jgi:hypothetical protein
MTSETDVPDRLEFRQQWAKIDKDARRRVRRAANGGGESRMYARRSSGVVTFAGRLPGPSR